MKAERSTAHCALILIGLLGSASLICAQAPATRYELGRRLAAMERAFEMHSGPVARGRALPHLVDAVGAFFGLRMSKAGQRLDQARFALASSDLPSEDLALATSLAIELETKALTRGPAALRARIKPFYETGVKLPPDLRIVGVLMSGDGKAARGCVDLPITELPTEVPLQVGDLAEADLRLELQFLRGEQRILQSEHHLSIVESPIPRAQAILHAKVDAAVASPSDLASLKAGAEAVVEAAKGRIAERDQPIVAWLRELERGRNLVENGKPWLSTRSGDFSCSLSVIDQVLPMRLQVPAGLTMEKPAPLIIAYHGAGGSENMWFEAYGAGKLPRLAASRGFIVAALRSGGGRVGIGAITEALAKHWPIDRTRIVVIGHSMGASQAIAAVTREPQFIRAVGIFGGGGAPKDPTVWSKIASFGGAGSEDFGRSGVVAFCEALTAVGHKKVKLETITPSEHLTVVQAGLDTWFAWLDAELKP